MFNGKHSELRIPPPLWGRVGRGDKLTNHYKQSYSVTFCNKEGEINPLSLPSPTRGEGVRILWVFFSLLTSNYLLPTHPHAADPPSSKFILRDRGTEFPVAYEKYGSFTGQGTNEYKYKLVNRPGLEREMGSGLYPNSNSLFKEPGYLRWKKRHSTDLNHWNYVNTGNPEMEFYVWATAKEVGPGTKLLFTGQALSLRGDFRQALKAYYAVLIHFPKEACWSADHSFVWYVGEEALNRIDWLTNHRSEIGYHLEGQLFEVKNGTDTDLSNDRFLIDPGHWVKNDKSPIKDLSSLKIINQRGFGKVQVLQFENKHWQLQVNGQPFFIKGVSYTPTPVGQHISAYGNRWMFEDSDENGKSDAPYDSWVDNNHNGNQDRDEPSVGDFELMKQMGVNAIRIYRNSQSTEYDSSEFKKETLRDLQARYGIYVIMGDLLGAYTIGSGAGWEEGTDYTNPVQLENMRLCVKNYVLDHREEPYVLMWLLGNENLMPADYSRVNSTRTQAAEQVESYLTFVNEIAEMLHQIDPEHPVAVGNMDILHLKEHALYAPQVDIFGANAYRGNMGFGTLWKKVAETLDRPLLLTEYGCDAFDSRKKAEDELAQANYHEAAWNDIVSHKAGRGVGNSIGGVVFEFLDEWWKSPNGTWDSHDGTPDGPMAFPDGWASEEWNGLISRGKGADSSYLRQPRKVYYLYRDNLWGNSNTPQ